jgi:hypothetical protein
MQSFDVEGHQRNGLEHYACRKKQHAGTDVGERFARNDNTSEVHPVNRGVTQAQTV